MAIELSGLQDHLRAKLMEELIEFVDYHVLLRAKRRAKEKLLMYNHRQCLRKKKS